MRALSFYDLIINNTKKEVEIQQQKYYVEEMTPFFKFKDDVRILSAAGQISEIFLQVHNLSHYKHKKTDIEIGVSIKTCIESLVFDSIEGGYFSLMGGD